MATSNSRAVFAVLNLSWTCMKKDLRQHFSKYGRVYRVSIPMDLKSGFSRHVGFVELRGPKGFEEKILQDYHVVDRQEVTVKARVQKETKSPPQESEL